MITRRRMRGELGIMRLTSRWRKILRLRSGQAGGSVAS
jgi:hypothetical protein